MLVNGKNVRVSFEYQSRKRVPGSWRYQRVKGEGVLLGEINCGTYYRGLILGDDLLIHRPCSGEYRVIGLGDLNQTTS